jgi:predicted nuclease of predicted toxin-antitoxin system
VKLLFDEYLSYRLIAQLATVFPGSQHVDLVGLHSRTDIEIWDFAGNNGFTIVTKDNDFRQRSFLNGAPPKIVWLSIGNAGTQRIARLLVDNSQIIEVFFRDADDSLLILELPED